MTARTSSAGPSGRAGRRATGDDAPDAGTGPFTLTLCLTGGVALALGPLLAVVRTPDGETPAAGFTAWPLLMVLALAPPVTALGLAGGAPRTASGLVLGLAALAPARALIDLQLATDAGLAARPELVQPVSLAPLHAGPGLVLLLTGHLLTALAGVAVLAARRRKPGGTDAVTVVPDVAGPPRQGLLLGVLVLGALAAVGLLGTPFRSATPFLVARSAFDGPGWVLAGTALLGVLAAVAACVLVASPDRELARGGLLGVAAGVAAVAAPPLAAGLVGASLDPAPGPAAALLAAAGLALLARPAGRERAGATAAAAPELVLPAADRLHRVAGGVALLAATLAVAGLLAPTLTLPPGVGEPVLLVERLLAPAALVLGLLGVALLLLPAATAAAVRPALSVAWVAGPLVALAVLNPAITATDLGGVPLGPGSWAVLALLVAAAGAGVCAALAGGVERDDVDVSALAARDPDRPLLVAAACAALLAVPAFALPVAEPAGRSLLAIGEGAGTGGWGLVAGLVAVGLAALVAVRCRPVRGAALLAGAGLVVLVRLAELPLVAAPLAGTAVAAGTWCCLACLAALGLAVLRAVLCAAGSAGGSGSSRRAGAASRNTLG